MIVVPEFASEAVAIENVDPSLVPPAKVKRGGGLGGAGKRRGGKETDDDASEDDTDEEEDEERAPPEAYVVDRVIATVKQRQVPDWALHQAALDCTWLKGCRPLPPATSAVADASTDTRAVVETPAPTDSFMLLVGWRDERSGCHTRRDHMGRV